MRPARVRAAFGRSLLVERHPEEVLIVVDLGDQEGDYVNLTWSQARRLSEIITAGLAAREKGRSK